MRLQAASEEVLQALVRRLPGRWTPAPTAGAERVYSFFAAAPGDEHVLLRNGEEIGRSTDLGFVLAMLAGSVGFYVGESSVELTFLHAGVVGWLGHSILLPGQENTGKTTLTAALVRAGASYLSDDFAPIDDEGLTHPFPRPLSIRQGGGRPPRFEWVESLGGTQETEPLPVGLVVFSSYRGLAGWRPRRVSAGRGVLDLLAHCLSAQTRPQEALRRLGLVVGSAPVLRGGRGDASEAAAAILRRLERSLERAALDV